MRRFCLPFVQNLCFCFAGVSDPNLLSISGLQEAYVSGLADFCGIKYGAIEDDTKFIDFSDRRFTAL